MKRIKLLDSSTIEKIAAGEVIERPASIIKELLENSIDANSSNITIEIKQGGKNFIRVTDDGDGIVRDDLSLAFKRHSTSKLNTIDDLYRITSLGFRGEALASIASVAKIKIMTKTKDALAGIEADLEEGEIMNETLVGTPKGTTIIVRDLFYNLPVRKEFLKTDLSESNKISDIVYKLALGNPLINFKYIKDGKTILTTSKKVDLKNHIYSVLGKEFSENLIKIDYQNEHIKLNGFISNNQYYRGNRSHQYLFINNRFIINSNISKTIEYNYRNLIPINRFPVYLLFMYINGNKIDVNIHPTKQEVKFTNENQVLDIINDVIKKALSPKIEVPRMQISKQKTTEKTSIPNLFDFVNEKDINKDDTRNSNVIIEDYRSVDRINGEIDFIKENIPLIYEDDSNNKNISQEIKEDTINLIENLIPIGVVFNTFIIAQDSLNNKLYFIDQHAAHERIMYEKYLKEFKEEKINIQKLLIPVVIDLNNEEMENVLSNLITFLKLGFEIEAFGDSSIIIRGAPLVFGHPNIKNLFYDLLDNINSNILSNYETKLDKIMKIACVNSVKGGDKLDDKEILALFDRLKQCNQPHTCPHGRPTMLEMSKTHIEKEFLRIM